MDETSESAALPTDDSSQCVHESSEDPSRGPGDQNPGDQNPAEEIERESEALYSASQPNSEDEEETLFETQNSEELGSENAVHQLTIEHTVSETDEQSTQSLLMECAQLRTEKEELAQQLAAIRTTGVRKEQSFQEIAKELEQKCFSQQEQLESLQEQLEAEQERAQEKVLSVEKELACRVDQVTKMYEDVMHEKEDLVGKVELLDGERKKVIDELTTAEQKYREALKENDKIQGVVKKQKGEIAKLQANCEKSEARAVDQGKEVARLKEEVSSLGTKIKWAQNKLKTETEAHKETKVQLAATSKKLKESREEGEQIRADLKRMITQYQESEDMRSNSLGVQLKKTEKELKQHEQEIVDQQQLHELTVKELELVKAAHMISQEECQQLKNRISDLNARITEQSAEVEELKAVVIRQKADQKKLTMEMSGLEQLNQGIKSERSRFSSLRESHAQLQRSHQHQERELGRRREREEELLALTEKLSSANAELQVEKSSWESKLTALVQERDSLVEARKEGQAAAEELERLREESQSHIAELLQKVEDKSKAVEQLTMALEDEMEQNKALKRKHSSNVKDMQRQLQQCKRRIEQLETASSSEPPATLPISEISRASSHSSLDGIGTTVTTITPATTGTNNTRVTSGTSGNTCTAIVGGGLQPGRPSSDDERLGASPSPELFQTLDQEKMLLVEKLCKLRRQLAKKEEKMEFFEEHSHQLTEDIQRKSKIIQNFILREQEGALAPPSYDAHKVRHSRKGGIMATVFSGKPSTDMNHELSLEMNRKMQSILEDTLLKNITLKENIDTLGREIQRLSAQLQTYDSSGR